MTGTTGAVHLARRDPGYADLRPLSTPNRPITIPHGRGRAGEPFSSPHDWHRCRVTISSGRERQDRTGRNYGGQRERNR